MALFEEWVQKGHEFLHDIMKEIRGGEVHKGGLQGYKEARNVGRG